MTVKFFNTLSREVEEFKPIKKGRAGMYTCGPTVYDYAHIGNLRTYIFEDLLKRVLRANKIKVKHVMNVTDVGHLTSDADEGEDKIEKGSRREGKSAWEIADFYTRAFIRDLAALNVFRADVLCRATAHIKNQIRLIKKLERKGFTYRTADGIYFDTAKLADYGQLARLQKDSLKAGARVQVGDKHNITDFALWKFSPPLHKRQMEWKSPWGMGFPGWHIECSAMSIKYLGQPFDIHCGGVDHIPVHHTNEIAQSEAAYGKPLAHYWLHGEFLLMGSGDKMAKSGDNFVTLETLKEKGIDPLAYRYLILQTHYRKQLTFSWEALKAAQNGLHHLYALAGELATPSKIEPTIREKFLQAVNNDLDFPAALALVWEKLKAGVMDLTTLVALDEILGLKIKETVSANKKSDNDIPKNILVLSREREEARANKDWARSDALRIKIEALGFNLEDSQKGTKISKK